MIAGTQEQKHNQMRTMAASETEQERLGMPPSRAADPFGLEVRIKAAEKARVLELSPLSALIEVDSPLAPGKEYSMTLPTRMPGEEVAQALSGSQGDRSWTGGLRLRVRVRRCQAVMSAVTGALAYRGKLEVIDLPESEERILREAVSGLESARRCRA